MSRSERRNQLLDVARKIIRDEGTDRLTLGHLAACAGVSKPIAYDHFGDRSGLLIALYKWIDEERMNAFLDGIAGRNPDARDAIDELATAYIDCASDTAGDFQVVGAALAGSEQKSAVLQELLNQAVAMFVSVLKQHSELPQEELERRCIGLVGAGEALAMALLRGTCDDADAKKTFASMIHACV
ncbi:MAG: TetR/AcrR family transcriptional regulator [Roseovarius sp.]